MSPRAGADPGYPGGMVRLALLLSAVLAQGCSQTVIADGDDGAAPSPVACDVLEEPLAADQDAGLGFTPAAVLARFGGVRQATLEYYAGGTSELTLELTQTGPAVQVTTSDPPGVDAADLLGPCGDVSMRLPVELRFTTADGRFDERIPAVWQLYELAAAESVNTYVELAALGGSYTSEATRLSFVVLLAEAEQSGSVVGVVDVEEELGTEFNVARFNESTWPQSE